MENGSPGKPKVLLSIVTWNHEKTILETLDSIRNQTYRHFELVILDNKSADGTIKLLREYQAKLKFELIEHTENIGFSGGHNHIISNYSFDYIILVNPDIILNPDYVEQTLKAFQIHPDIGAVCGLLVQSSADNPIIDSAGMELTRSRRFILKDHGKQLNTIQLESGYVAGLDGALPAFKKEAVLASLVNGEFFNSMFFSHKEDWDISWRLILFGWKVYFNKESIAVHPRFFKPNQLKLRKSIDDTIKYHGFKNQFLLLLINEDRSNFMKDILSIVPRIIITTVFCLLFERGSLKAYSYLSTNKKEIKARRKNIHERRKVGPQEFRRHFISAG
ncbi:MAG TPA: glycosyltransferase [Chitinophagaceae bacterium]|nr:glycosyltransferase [Chitinophagaceae bacterium]